MRLGGAIWEFSEGCLPLSAVAAFAGGHLSRHRKRSPVGHVIGLAAVDLLALLAMPPWQESASPMRLGEANWEFSEGCLPLSAVPAFAGGDLSRIQKRIRKEGLVRSKNEIQSVQLDPSSRSKVFYLRSCLYSCFTAMAVFAFWVPTDCFIKCGYEKMSNALLVEALGTKDLDSGFDDKPSSHLISTESELSMKEEIGAGPGAH
ncbi:hypothetical protein Cgig2_018633 [Carnegiea gigantea]|uniref:Uncharacterized protein n=1 Tax=Carnegiea gigantea TaxID=171969 RepID=A0A9Q1QHH6_9CARY|nr:hypothetical protein Cgig2_018633 [Carnegiea gigantea]